MSLQSSARPKTLELLLRLEDAYDQLSATWSRLTIEDILALWERAQNLVDELNALKEGGAPLSECDADPVESVKLRVVCKNKILEQELAESLKGLKGQIDRTDEWETVLRGLASPSSSTGTASRIDFSA